AAEFEKLADGVREFRESVLFATAMNHAVGDVDFNLIVFADRFVKRRAFDDRQSRVDRVAIERPRERTRDHGLHAQADDRRCGLLTRTATSEVPAGHKDVVTSKLPRHIGAKNFESVLGQLFRLYIYKVAAGNDD